jgi:hypothetical protein
MAGNKTVVNKREKNMVPRKKKRTSKAKDIMTELNPISIENGQVLHVTLNGQVKLELRVTPLGQPEIFCDHTQIVRLFRDWYQPNETC